jgi:hypothetical protein
MVFHKERLGGRCGGRGGLRDKFLGWRWLWRDRTGINFVVRI